MSGDSGAPALRPRRQSGQHDAPNSKAPTFHVDLPRDQTQHPSGESRRVCSVEESDGAVTYLVFASFFGGGIFSTFRTEASMSMSALAASISFQMSTQ